MPLRAVAFKPPAPLPPGPADPNGRRSPPSGNSSRPIATHSRSDLAETRRIPLLRSKALRNPRLYPSVRPDFRLDLIKKSPTRVSGTGQSIIHATLRVNRSQTRPAPYRRRLFVEPCAAPPRWGMGFLLLSAARSCCHFAESFAGSADGSERSPSPPATHRRPWGWAAIAPRGILPPQKATGRMPKHVLRGAGSRNLVTVCRALARVGARSPLA